MSFADIIVPGALADTYTYRVGADLMPRLKEGSRVIVPFGKSRKVIGVVDRLHSSDPGLEKLKSVIAIPEFVDSISPQQLRLWRWISEYYMCTMGEVMDASLPAGLKLESQPAESEEELRQKYRPKMVKWVSLRGGYNEAAASSLLDKLSGSPARKRLLEAYLEIIEFGSSGDHFAEADKLLKEARVSAAILPAMVKSGIFIVEEREESAGVDDRVSVRKPAELSSAQAEATAKIRSSLDAKMPVLLKGVTSSGKTEIYVHLIKEQLEKGNQVLYLLPEIALTTQIISRLKSYFGDEVGVYHSRFADRERVDVWRRAGSGGPSSRYRLLLGVRSSIFLPFEKLGLIIVDEEHDQSYKQKDPAPRYNARDMAIVLASIHGAGVLLGSATPSIESYYNCATGKYSLVELNTRFGDVKLPQIELSDTREAYRRKIMVSHFTPQLVKATEEALGKGEQVIYFRNRRGYAPLLVCNDCGWTPLCNSCSVSMTYHRGANHLRCHYCGSNSTLPVKCGNCGSSDIRMKGYGTEKIEDEIALLFPEARVARMDLDTTRQKGSVDRLIASLENGSIDILVGTQMISKGLDFENLTLIGVLNADSMLRLPDFRANERCFQMIEQVSGRAGRREKQGRVVIQTGDPANSTIRQALNHDYEAMYNEIIAEREEFGYPPFTRLIRIYLKHPRRDIVMRSARMLAKTLRENIPAMVLGPESPPVERVQNYHLMTILVKGDREAATLKRIKSFIKKAAEYTLSVEKTSSLRIYADVDPV